MTKLQQSPAPTPKPEALQQKVENKIEVKEKIAKKPALKVNRNTYIIIGGLVLVCVVAVGASLSLLSMLPKKAATVQQLRTQALSIQMSTQDEALLNQDLKDTERDRQRLLAAFPNETSLLDFIRTIDSLRGGSVEVLRFSLDSDVPTKIGRNPSFLPVSLILKGSEESVSQALTRVVNSPYFIRPLTFSKDSDPTTKQVIVQTQFHLYVDDAFTKTNP